MVDYIEFSAKIKEKYPEYKDVDDLTLAQKIVEKYPEYKEKVTFEGVKDGVEQPKAEKKGIDLTPSGLVKKIGNTSAAAILTPLEMIKDKQGAKEAYSDVLNRIETTNAMLEKEHPIQTGIRDFTTDMVGYSVLPFLRGNGLGTFIGNAAIQGGVPGALESLKRGGNAVTGAEAGTGIAAALQGIPKVGNLLAKGGQKALELSGRIGQIKPETLKQVIKPESQALEMTSDDATNELLNITKQIRENFNKLKTSRGEAVDDAIRNLPEDTPKFDINNLLDDIKGTFDNYQLDRANPARSLAGGLEDDLSLLIKPLADDAGLVSPLSLQGAKKTIGQLGKWGEETARGYAEPITEQVYGKFANRLNELSPEVKAANKAFSDLMAFKKNDTVSQILKGDLLSEGKLGGAPGALKAYKSTINKGSGQENLKNLENLLVKEKLQDPFLNKIDDINAAMDLLKTENTGIGGMASIAKALLTRPVLTAARGANRMNLTDKIQNVKDALAPIAKLMPALGAKGAANLLYGGVEYNDYR